MREHKNPKSAKRSKRSQPETAPSVPALAAPSPVAAVEKMVDFNFKVSWEFRQKVRMHALAHGITTRQTMLNALEEYCTNHP